MLRLSGQSRRPFFAIDDGTRIPDLAADSCHAAGFRADVWRRIAGRAEARGRRTSHHLGEGPVAPDRAGGWDVGEGPPATCAARAGGSAVPGRARRLGHGEVAGLVTSA